jgi:hypothetical protein
MDLCPIDRVRSRRDTPRDGRLSAGPWSALREVEMRQSLLNCLGFLSAALLVAACGKKEEAPAPATPAVAGSADSAAAAAATPGSWTPEALEELLAPIALYPDVVLGHVLTASTNPQEVLDAGNWLIENQELSGAQLDSQAGKLGLSPSVRALVQFPEVMDMMCMQMDWTTELGQAFNADQAAVLDAVQRLRKQAKEVGNLESSPQLKVETESQDGKEIVTVEPPSPEVVYVPKYDPAAVYAPPPATIPPPSTINVTGAPGTTTTVTTSGTTTTVAAAPTSTTTESKGHSTGTLVTTGLLAFGAGILVNEVFDDDDWDDHYPNYYHGGMYYGGAPYYPPPPYMYRPPYGNGYYPAHHYNRPANYQRGFNNNTIIVNNKGNDYWNRYGRNQDKLRDRKAQSPITDARPNRPELNDLNRRSQERTRQAERPATRDALPGQTRQAGYAGARPENKAARERMVAKSPPAGVARDLPTRPKTEYKGATNRPTGASRAADARRPSSANRPPGPREPSQHRPSGTADRGRDGSTAARPSAGHQAPAARHQPAQRPAADRAAPQVQHAAPQRSHQTAFGASGDGGAARSGHQARQASQRGRSSAGGGNKSRKPRR